MKRFTSIIIALALLLSPSSAWAAIALVASAVGSTNNGAATTGAIDTTGANLLVITASDVHVNPVTIADSKTNTWTALTVRTNSATVRTRIYYCVPTSVGTGHTATATIAGGLPIISFHAFSGAHATPFDQENGGTGTGTTSKQPGSVTPSQDGCLLVFGANYRTGTGGSVNGGFTGTFTDFASGAHIGGGGGYLIQTTAAAANPTISWTGSNDSSAAIASFKAANSIGPIAAHLSRLRQ